MFHFTALTESVVDSVTVRVNVASVKVVVSFPVMMSLANETDFQRVGAVDFVDNRVVATTGTVRMRGVFENPTSLLKAGMFVRIRLPIGHNH